MKKTLLMLSMTLMVVLGTVSCSQQEEESMLPTLVEVSKVENDVDAMAMAKLKLQIQELNAKYGFNSVKSETRISFLPKWLKFLVSTVVCDAVGALVGAETGGKVGGQVGAIAGAVVLGVASSIYCACNQESIDLSRKTRANVKDVWSPAMSDLIITSSQNVKEDSVGYFHNLVVLCMNENDPTLMNTTTYNRTDLLDSICPYRPVIGYPSGYMNTLMNSVGSTPHTEVRAFIAYGFASDYFGSIPPRPYWQSRSDDLNIVFDFASNIIDDSGSVNFQTYTTQLIGIIESSELTAAHKRNLKYALLVGYSSKKLWESRLLK